MGNTKYVSNQQQGNSNYDFVEVINFYTNKKKKKKSIENSQLGYLQHLFLCHGFFFHPISSTEQPQMSFSSLEWVISKKHPDPIKCLQRWTVIQPKAENNSAHILAEILQSKKMWFCDSFYFLQRQHQDGERQSQGHLF